MVIYKTNFLNISTKHNFEIAETLLAWFFFINNNHSLRDRPFNIRLYGKNSESDYSFFPPPKSEYFFSNIGNQNNFV